MDRLVGLAVLVDLDVDVVQVRDGVLLELLLGPVPLEADGEDTCERRIATGSASCPSTQARHSENRRTKLLAPVAEVVHAEDVPAVGLVEVGEEGADDGRAEVAGVERLGDVGRRELDDDALALARLVRAVPVLLCERETLGELVGAGVVEREVGKVRQRRVVLVRREVRLRVDLVEDGAEQGLGLEVEVDERAARANLGEVRRRLELRA